MHKKKGSRNVLQVATTHVRIFVVFIFQFPSNFTTYYARGLCQINVRRFCVGHLNSCHLRHLCPILTVNVREIFSCQFDINFINVGHLRQQLILNTLNKHYSVYLCSAMHGLVPLWRVADESLKS